MVDTATANTNLKTLHIKLACYFSCAAIVGVIVGYFTSPGDFPWTIKIIGFLWILVLLYIQAAYKENQRQIRIQSAESYYRNNPVSTRAAWDLAQVKLESYIDRNLDHIRWIFFIALAVILVGCGLVFLGVTQAFKNTSEVTPAILSSASGVITQFLGGTLLVLYRSTMQQAKDYVQILERINAVGMSVQILERQPDEESDLCELARIEMAQQVLANFASINSPAISHIVNKKTNEQSN
jgi:uncharacterized membrane protein YfcA